MATINVLGRSIDVDVREELEQYEWNHAKWTDDKLIASSPFRDDRSPSFWVTLTGEYAGVFGDSAYDDDYYKAGGLPKLLAFLRDESYEESCEYLLDKYDYEYSNNDVVLVSDIRLTKQQRVKHLPRSVYDKPLDSEYLPSRCIHPKVIELQGVFDNGDSIGIVWRDINGVPSAVKYRHKKSKYFWYEDDATPLAQLIYGLNVVYKRGIKRIAICEAEIDAMTWQSAGIYAVAIGGARFNDKQADMIVASGVEEVILAGDNDKQGRKFNELVKSKLTGVVQFNEIDYNYFGYYKDVNELGVDKIPNIPLIKRKVGIRI